MPKIHVNEDNVPRICRAKTPESCPLNLSGEVKHFDDWEEARKYAEEQLENEHPIQRKKNKYHDYNRIVKHLRHFSELPLELNRETKYPQESNRKPAGFWVSVEDGSGGWSDFCKQENYGTVENETIITVREDANILHISDATGLDKLDEKYGVTIRNEYYTERLVDWGKVAEDYDGIIISPVVWDRHSMFGTTPWYYGWDVSSGCIWNLEAIESTEPSEENSTRNSSSDSTEDFWESLLM